VDARGRLSKFVGVSVQVEPKDDRTLAKTVRARVIQETAGGLGRMETSGQSWSGTKLRREPEEDRDKSDPKGKNLRRGAWQRLLREPAGSRRRVMLPSR